MQQKNRLAKLREQKQVEQTALQQLLMSICMGQLTRDLRC